MKFPKLAAAVAACACILTSAPAFATMEHGWFDRADIAMVDTLYGWVCAVPWFTTPQGNSIVVYLDGPAGQGGTLYGEFPLNNNWYQYRPDVAAAGYCGGYQYSGWSVIGWFYQNRPTTIYVYYKDAFAGGSLTLLGWPKVVTGGGSF